MSSWRFNSHRGKRWEGDKRDLVNLQKKSRVPLRTCCWQHRSMLGTCCSHLWCPDLTPEGFPGQNGGGKQSPQGCQSALLQFTPVLLHTNSTPSSCSQPTMNFCWEFLMSGFRPHTGRDWSKNLRQELLAAALQDGTVVQNVVHLK